MMPGQHRAAQVVKTSLARLAQVALPMPLSVIMAIADDDDTVAVRTAQTIRPAMLTHEFKALGLVQQARKVDHVEYGHGCAASSDHLDDVPTQSDQSPHLGTTPQSHHPKIQ